MLVLESLESRDLAASAFVWPRWQFAVNVVPARAIRPYVAPAWQPMVNVVPRTAPTPYVVPNWGFWGRHI